MAEPNQPPQALIPRDLLKRLGEHRDGFLVGGAVLYSLGYLVRWSYASFYRLGDIPALDFQYVMAGVIPAFFFALTWAAVALFSRLRLTVAGAFAKRRTLVYRLLGVPLFGACFLGLFGIRRMGPWIFVSFGTIVAVLYLLDLVDGQGHWTTRYLLPLLLCIFFLSFYLAMYPHIPRQLGGSQPRLACLDLVRDEIAPATLNDLASKGKLGCPGLSGIAASASEIEANLEKIQHEGGKEPDKIVRSGRVAVYFSSADYLLVRADTGDSSSPINVNTLYELRKETIRAIQWCDERD